MVHVVSRNNAPRKGVRKMDAKELLKVKRAASLVDKVLEEVSEYAAGWLVEYIKSRIENRKDDQKGAGNDIGS